ncbi:putative GntR-family transcriptional regulator [Janibacter sp. HTCC2649]|uniref:GntR family transcriptional regulator n=1 Tax=Janibacter sp. HTCC2649 TaxID=313589 RepID=UPI0000671968|nr:GntR family transcriptional regulator [Janibacter sp. HTCC2649]EAP98119.1 putative GntR-family transcriptional regulator [Janibacter sp. HTCC2649]
MPPAPDRAHRTDADLAALPSLPRRASTAEAVAGVLRGQISEGRILPGAQLREEHLAAALEVSRNTVREAFRLLAHERLVEHALHRGVFVRTVGPDGIREMYRTRRLVEPIGVRGITGPDQVSALRDVVTRGTAAADAGDWEGVGTADIDFHRLLVGASDSVHLSSMFEGLLAELRLAFLRLPDRKALHEPFLARNVRLLDLIEAGDTEAALAELDDYLVAAETQLLAAATNRNPT